MSNPNDKLEERVYDHESRLSSHENAIENLKTTVKTHSNYFSKGTWLVLSFVISAILYFVFTGQIK